MKTKFLLDSGDPKEYREIALLAQKAGCELWGATTNPSLIAKEELLLAKEQNRPKITRSEAFEKQKDIILEILQIVPGAVSAEVYADEKTTAEEMIEQGREIATWHDRVVVKLPTTIEGFKARTVLRQDKIVINNTLVFSLEQIFAICLHDALIAKTYFPTVTPLQTQREKFPCFISPFIGRLDDLGLQGISLVTYGMTLKRDMQSPLWMLSASIRSLDHLKQSINAGTELITAPAAIYREFFTSNETVAKNTNTQLKPITIWKPEDAIKNIQTLKEFIDALETKKLDIYHELTEKGIQKFAADWASIMAE